MKSVDVNRIAGPADVLATRADGEAGELLDLAARRVLARQPLGVE